MVHFAGYTPAFSPVGLRVTASRRRRRRLAHLLRGPHAPTTNGSRRAARRRAGLALGGPPPLPAVAASDRRQGQAFVRGGAQRLGIECASARSASANGRFGNRPHCIYRGFCLQGCKVNAKASPLDHPRPRRAGARGGDPRRLHGRRGSRPTPPGRCDRSDLLPRRRGALPGRRGRRGRRLLDRDSAPAAQFRQPPVPRRPRQRHSIWSGATSWCRERRRPPAGTTEEVRPTRRRRRRSSSEAFYETDPARGLRAGLRPPVRRASADRLRRARHSPRDIGGTRCGSTCAISFTGTRSARLASSCREPTTGSPSPTEPDRHGMPVAELRLLNVRQRPRHRRGGDQDHDRNAPCSRRHRGDHDRPLRPPGRRLRMAPTRERGHRRRPSLLCAVPNLYVTDGSVLPTQGSANPALTIMALAARAAEHLSATNRGWAR